MSASAPVCLPDFEAMAIRLLPPDRAAYLFGGSADDITVQANRRAFDDLMLLPRVLTDLRQASPKTTLFGDEYAAPIFVAPMGYQKLFHAAGEIGLAQAAAAMGAGFVLSTLASSTLEAVSAAGEGAPQWFQLYWQPDREVTLALIRRAEEAGYRAIMITVDAPVNGIRNREMRAGFVLPPEIRAVNLPPNGDRRLRPEAFLGGLLDQAPVWADMTWLRRATTLPLLIKGILHPADARRVGEMGFDGLVVSNHGGRTLDTAVPAPVILPAIRHSVGDSLPILIDGGIRRGTDVFKALALGANGVLVGRPMAAALAAEGAHGVARALRILIDEFAVAMALCGCAAPSEITADRLVAASGEALR